MKLWEKNVFFFYRGKVEVIRMDNLVLLEFVQSGGIIKSRFVYLQLVGKKIFQCLFRMGLDRVRL